MWTKTSLNSGISYEVIIYQQLLVQIPVQKATLLLTFTCISGKGKR